LIEEKKSEKLHLLPTYFKIRNMIQQIYFINLKTENIEYSPSTHNRRKMNPRYIKDKILMLLKWIFAATQDHQNTTTQAIWFSLYFTILDKQPRCNNNYTQNYERT
jgi:hypothetical protein